MAPVKEITLDIVGLGIIIYSPFAVSHISEGEDYFNSNYLDEEQVQQHIQQGTIVCFGTCSPGHFVIQIMQGYPSEEIIDNHEFRLRLGIEVRDRQVCIRDLYDLMDWVPQCPKHQVFKLANGFYHITLCSKRPASGILGDNQVILMYFNQLNQMPRLASEGIPTLCIEDE